ncbi:MAG TPA: cyclic nucleotide-binding domain-containing protein [Fimbriimonadaceae bacterium]|nr:cyclic nucleotide-binding domain-containing protein [Fimbriimonadaceae bacterium]
MDVIGAIRFNYLFRGLSKEQIERVAEIVEQRKLDGGEIMVRQFDRDTDLMIIVTGGAKIKSFSGETLAEVGPGSVIGEVSLVDDQPRSATVVAVGTTVVAVIPGKKLGDLVNEDVALKAQLVLNIGKVLCQRLRTANVQLDAALAKESSAQLL